MKKLNKYIDYTNLKADAKKDDIIRLCKEAKQYKLYSVCINPNYISLAKKELRDTDVKITTVVGFPLGASISDVKGYETRRAVEKGADEIDMVINISAVKNNDYDLVKKDIETVKNNALGRKLKIILETCLLEEEEIIKLCDIAKEIKVDFVKTSTGFSSYGARLEDIRIMKKVLGDDIGIKASGGIKTRADAELFIKEGATRIGTSSLII
ncbi:MAG: deoxyribose-phosphate aldolase [Andreesenia angusta]|nr:deoxyribose-phosphate aldolase [Andreesenia angusta]